MITVNSVKYPLEENSSLRKVLEDLNFNVELTVCEVNKNLVKKIDYDNFIVTDNDEIEVFSFVGGG
ncbi:MAG: sulfur carrier protein ThiS [Finegoldia magna]|jgi:thiamine biosynthesis protein thiS|uniref:Thiamine biosynthesis protein ThiS n=1 Tax=Finegoldia magna TaxID=1260 RepID=A0A2N6ST13_FINMA|nr:sulfur carrier protein ThiS [Finegoldia magna]MBS5971526.1 sulfur carrier protein ThiS [Finegoldia magna]MDU5214770.1 sulfur carrier protein ThiS [Finegoldia magna]MDU5588237.1 sulfur carrier protein ThiS [Finegoldia magna]MDU6880585.1 sulfur carrier protein ThiS [Finegoldia magna]MDU7331480.1 sulfur carrier protein ThiS [Finegoldia magna]